MNFMNRKMFQVGGTVTYADGRTDNISIEDFTQQISALSDADLFALRNSADAGQIFISPELKTILDSVTDRKSIPITQNIGRPASISSLKDVGRIAKGLYLPAISGLTRQIFSEEQLANMPAVRSVAEYDSPFYGEGITGFRETAQRGGRSAEELAAILQPSIQDFSEEVDEISMPQEIQDEVVEPITRIESETLGQPTDTSEAERRRREYEASLAGRDEFGEILPESRLLPELPTEDQNEIDNHVKIIEDEIKISKLDARMRELENWLKLINLELNI